MVKKRGCPLPRRHRGALFIPAPTPAASRAPHLLGILFCTGPGICSRIAGGRLAADQRALMITVVPDAQLQGILEVAQCYSKAESTSMSTCPAWPPSSWPHRNEAHRWVWHLPPSHLNPSCDAVRKSVAKQSVSHRSHMQAVVPV